MTRGVTRGLFGSVQARAAADIDVQYGRDLLLRASASWPRYLAITSPTALRCAKPRLAEEPAGVAYIESLDFSYLQATADRLPDDVGLVVGLGGGRVLDAAKHVAAAKDLPLIQVPTIISSGAIIHGYCGTFQGRTLVGNREEWAWADCEQVLVDYELVLQAPAHLNTAGLGDVLCEQSGIAEWHRKRRAAPDKTPHHHALGRLTSFHARIARQFPLTLDAHGQLTDNSIYLIMETLKRRDDVRVYLPTAPNVDHQFLAALEVAAGRNFVHGEGVALGALIVGWQCEEAAETFAATLDECRIRRRPSELGISKDELRQALSLLTDDLSAKPEAPEYGSVMREEPINGDRFEELWAFLTVG